MSRKTLLSLILLAALALLSGVHRPSPHFLEQPIGSGYPTSNGLIYVPNIATYGATLPISLSLWVSEPTTAAAAATSLDKYVTVPPPVAFAIGSAKVERIAASPHTHDSDPRSLKGSGHAITVRTNIGEQIATSSGTGTSSNGYIAPATYHITPSGNNSGDGSADHPWLTPNHSIKCGDTVLLDPGNYDYRNFDYGKWGHVFGCPSSTGRNTAWLKCAGTHVTDCAFLDAYQSFRVDQSNWAIIGMYCSHNNVKFSTCFQAGYAGPTCRSKCPAPYVLFIGNYDERAGAGIGPGD